MECAVELGLHGSQLRRPVAVFRRDNRPHTVYSTFRDRWNDELHQRQYLRVSGAGSLTMQVTARYIHPAQIIVQQGVQKISLPLNYAAIPI